MNIQANSMYQLKHVLSLIKEIEGDEFHLSPLQGKLLLNDVEEIIDK